MGLIDDCNSLSWREVASRLGFTVMDRSSRMNECPRCGASDSRGAVEWRKGRFHCYRCDWHGRQVDLWLAATGGGDLRSKMAELEAWLGSDAVSIRRTVDELVVEAAPSMTPHDVQVWLNCLVPSLAVRRYVTVTRGVREVECSEVKQDAERRAVVWPLFSTHPDRFGEIVNATVRPIVRREGAPKSWYLVSGQGSAQDDGYPLCYGRPTTDADTLVLVEGGFDYMCARGWLDESIDVLGSIDAGNLRTRWHRVVSKYKRVIVVPHLDAPDSRGRRAGPDAVKELVAGNANVNYFPWVWFREQVRCHAAKDLADVVRAQSDGGCGVPWHVAGHVFRRVRWWI